jgi:hypothetical protein
MELGASPGRAWPWLSSSPDALQAFAMEKAIQPESATALAKYKRPANPTTAIRAEIFVTSAATSPAAASQGSRAWRGDKACQFTGTQRRPRHGLG